MDHENATYEEYVRWVESTGFNPSRAEFEALSISELQGIRDTITRWDEAKARNKGEAR